MLPTPDIGGRLYRSFCCAVRPDDDTRYTDFRPDLFPNRRGDVRLDFFSGCLEMAKGRPGKAVANERSHPFIIEVSVARQWIRPRIEP